MEIILIILIIILYFVGGSFFCLAYVKGYPQDTNPNLGVTVLFWIPIVIIHVCVQLAQGIGDISLNMAKRVDSVRPIKRKGQATVPYGRKPRKDNGPGTG